MTTQGNHLADGTTVYETETFQVLVANNELIEVGGCTYTGCYEVINRNTGIVEYKTHTLTDAANAAVQMDVTWRTKSFEWPLTKEQEQSQAEFTFAQATPGDSVQ